MDQQQQFLFNQAQITPAQSYASPAYMINDASIMSLNSLNSVSYLFHVYESEKSFFTQTHLKMISPEILEIFNVI